MKPIRLPELDAAAIDELSQLYRTTRDARLRNRAQMILLAAEIAEIVREDDQTVRNWLKRYLAEGLPGLEDAPRPSGPKKITEAYREQLLQVVRQRPQFRFAVLLMDFAAISRLYG